MPRESGTTPAVALDISKTFHRVWHAGLLHKCKSYGISGQIFGLISLCSFKCFQRGSLNAGIPEGLSLGCTFFLLYINDLMILSMMLLSVLMILELASEIESDLYDTVDWDRKWFVDFSAGKTQLIWFDQSNNSGAIDVKMDGSVLEEKIIF